MPRPRATNSIHIEAAPEDVYDFALGDLSSLADWMTSVDRVEDADERWPAVGASYVYSRGFDPHTVRGRTTVLEAERPRRVVMREEVLLQREAVPGQVPENRAGRSVWTFEPEGNGTLVTMQAEGIEMRPVTYALWRLLFSGRVSRNVEQTLSALKRICEEELEDASAEG